MTISRVQYVSTATTGSGGTTLSATLTAATAGNLIVAVVATGSTTSNGTCATPTGYTLDVGPITNTTANPPPINLYVFHKIAAGGETSFTATNTVTSGITVQVWEFSATAGWPANPVDVSANSPNQAAGTAPVTGTTVTTAQGEELWIGAMSANFGTQITFSAPTNSYTLEAAAWAGASPFFSPNTAALYKIVSATGTANTSVTSSASRAFAGISIAFKDNAAITRTVPTSAALQSTLTRQVTTSGAFEIARAVPTSAALLSTLTRQVPTSGVFEVARTVPTSAALQSTLTRQVLTSGVFEVARIVPTSAALQSTLTRQVPTSAALQGASIAYGGRAGSTSGVTASLTSFAVTTTATIPAGNIIVVSVTAGNVGDLSNVKTITDSASNTYVSGDFTVDVGQNQLTAVWYAVNNATLASGSTVTVTLNAAMLSFGTFWSATVDYLTGGATATPTDGSNKHNGQTGATWNTNSVTTTNASDLAWVAFGTNQGWPAALTNAGSTPTSGWTTLGTFNASGNGSGTAYQVFSSTGTYTGGGTATATNNGTSAVIVTFKTAAAAAPQRQVPTSAVLQSTLKRTVPTSGVFLSTLTRQVPTSAVLQSTLTRQVPTSAALSGGTTRQVPTSTALKSTLTRSVPTSVALYGVVPMPKISQGVPAFASDITYPPSNANDSDYSTLWRSVTVPSVSVPQWLAYDLSTVANVQRGKVLINLINEQGGQYYNTTSANAISLFTNYTIDANPAAGGGGSAPTTGWVTLATVTGNFYPARTHYVDLTGYNWVRVNVTVASGTAPNNDVMVQMDVHDAHLAQRDTWLFVGDSITDESLQHHNINGSAWGYGGALAQLVNAGKPAYFPATVDAGNGGMTMAWGATNASGLLANFTGGFVVVAFGTNDCNQAFAFTAGDSNVTTYYSNLLTFIDAAAALTQNPTIIVPYIPYGTANSGNLGINANLCNQYVDAHLPTDRPNVLRGPDFWTFFNNNQSLIRDGIHPTYTEAGTPAQPSGYEWQHKLYANWMLANVYGTPTRSVPTSAYFSQANITRQVPTSAALSLANITRQVPTSAALQSTLTRQVPTSVALSGGLTRQVPTSGVFSGINIIRPVPTSTALQATLTRQVPTSTSLLNTLSRSVLTSTALRSTFTHQVPTSVATLSTLTRQVPTSGVAQATLTRQVPTSANLIVGTLIRQVPTSGVFSGALARNVPMSAALLSTFTRTVPTSARFSQANIVRAVPTSASLYAAIAPVALGGVMPGGVASGGMPGTRANGSMPGTTISGIMTR